MRTFQTIADVNRRAHCLSPNKNAFQFGNFPFGAKSVTRRRQRAPSVPGYRHGDGRPSGVSRLPADADAEATRGLLRRRDADPLSVHLIKIIFAVTPGSNLFLSRLANEIWKGFLYLRVDTNLPVGQRDFFLLSEAPLYSINFTNNFHPLCKKMAGLTRV